MCLLGVGVQNRLRWRSSARRNTTQHFRPLRWSLDPKRNVPDEHSQHNAHSEVSGNPKIAFQFQNCVGAHCLWWPRTFRQSNGGQHRPFPQSSCHRQHQDQLQQDHQVPRHHGLQPERIQVSELSVRANQCKLDRENYREQSSWEDNELVTEQHISKWLSIRETTNKINWKKGLACRYGFWESLVVILFPICVDFHPEHPKQRPMATTFSSTNCTDEWKAPNSIWAPMSWIWIFITSACHIYTTPQAMTRTTWLSGESNSLRTGNSPADTAEEADELLCCAVFLLDVAFICRFCPQQPNAHSHLFNIYFLFLGDYRIAHCNFCKFGPKNVSFIPACGSEHNRATTFKTPPRFFRRISFLPIQSGFNFVAIPLKNFVNWWEKLVQFAQKPSNPCKSRTIGDVGVENMHGWPFSLLPVQSIPESIETSVRTTRSCSVVSRGKFTPILGTKCVYSVWKHEKGRERAHSLIDDELHQKLAGITKSRVVAKFTKVWYQSADSCHPDKLEQLSVQHIETILKISGWRVETK